MRKITKTLQTYDKGIFSWMGRVNIIKMDILPKILYIFQTIPIYPARNLLNQLRKVIGSVIWANKSARIKRKTLYRLKKDGGMALPDISLYLRSVFIARIVDWFHNMDCKQWVQLEDVADIKLRALPWTRREYRPREGAMPSLVVSTLKVWDNLIKRGIGSTLRGPMTPLFGNPEFSPAFGAKTFIKWRRWDDTRIVETLDENKLPPLDALGMEHRNK